MSLRRLRRQRLGIVLPFCFAVATGCESQRSVEPDRTLKATEIAPVAGTSTTSPLRVESADHGTFTYDSMKGRFETRPLNANMAARITTLINSLPFDFDPKFLERSEPYGEFQVDGRLFELHLGLLAEIRSRQVVGVWRSELISRMTSEFHADDDQESNVDRVLAMLDGTVDLPPRRPRKARPLQSSEIDHESSATKRDE